VYSYKELAPGVVVYNDVIPESNNLYNSIEEEMLSSGIEWSAAYVKESAESTVNTNTRDTSTIGVAYLGGINNNLTENIKENFFINLNNIFFKNFDPIEKHYTSMYGIGTDWHDQYGVLKYGLGQKFTNHIDDHPDFHRRVSSVYYLNDNYTGGELNFPRFNIKLKPKANQMIIFPSTYVYNHSVSPVVDGERYAVVSWLK
jgi:predicted 2-oxoglutarate/Fe(II)-dependent dioxygenase YbiX